MLPAVNFFNAHSKSGKEQEKSARLQAGMKTGTRTGGFWLVSTVEDLICSRVWVV
jgi:hypothetical protein